MSVRYGCTLLVFLCAGCAGSAARTPPTSPPLKPSSPVLVAKTHVVYGAEREPGALSMCQDSTASAELRLAWSTRSNGTRKVHGAGRARDASVERSRSAECVALRAPSVERE